MLDNLLKNTGKTLDQWIEIVKDQHFEKHSQILKFLKDEHSFTHGFANMVALKSRGKDSASVGDKEVLIEKQYGGKEHLKPIYDSLIDAVLKFGDDIVVAPKNTYVSLRRKKQFAILNPATKTRFEIGINLRGQEPKGKLEAEKPNAMCSHKINISDKKDIDSEVIEWIKTAYTHAE